jgi:hypothetical protein
MEWESHLQTHSCHIYHSEIHLMATAEVMFNVPLAASISIE